MAGRVPERTQSPAFLVLRASTRRLLKFVESEIARHGGGRVTIFNDQLEMIGSRRIYLPGLHELQALGLIELTRYPKRHVISLSDGWREINSLRDARAISAAAREQRKAPIAAAAMDTAPGP